MEKRRLNLGCGEVFHTDWTNIDVLDSTGKLLKYNLNLNINIIFFNLKFENVRE